METLTTLPIAVKVYPDRKLEALLAELSPAVPWGNRKIAAEKLGSLRNPQALPVLLNSLLMDSFWMVRSAIIQALIMIGDPAAIPTLAEVAEQDRYQVVRSYAKKAIERLS